MMTGPLPAEAIDAFVQSVGLGAAFPLLSVETRHLDGGFTRLRPGSGALARLDANCVMFAVSMTPGPRADARVRAPLA
jgi:hypothetical protein